jgi:hypothetical protein
LSELLPPPLLSVNSSRWRAWRASNVVISAILAIASYRILELEYVAIRGAVQKLPTRKSVRGRKKTAVLVDWSFWIVTILADLSLGLGSLGRR